MPMTPEEWEQYLKTHGAMLTHVLRLIEQANVRHAADTTWGREHVTESLGQFKRFIEEFQRLTEPPPRQKLEPRIENSDLVALGLLALAEEIGMSRDNQVRAARDAAPAHCEDSWSHPSIKLREWLVKKGVLDV